MRCYLTLLMLILVTWIPSVARAEFEGRPLINNALAPTGYTLGRGEVVLGLGPMAFGLNDNVQVGTNLLLWALQVYNADLKVAAYEGERGAVSLGVSAARFRADFDDDDDARFRSVTPHVAISHRVGENTLAHFNGRFAFFETSDDRDIEDADITATTVGRSLFAGLEHGMSERTRLLANVGYDGTFDTWRVSGGALFGWQTFRLKLGLHYVDAEGGIVLPMIGFRWRFQG